MNFQIKRLTPELANDFFDFFDNRAFTDNSPEGPCYCTRYQMTREEEQKELFGKIEENGGGREGFMRALRNIAERQIASGALKGYLAYADGVSIGWCNANDKNNFPIQSANGAQLHEPEERHIKAVVCFEIAPQFRGMGIASALLKRVADDAKAEGFYAVEGYPRVREARYEWDFTGPLALYEKCGFVKTALQGNAVVMRLSFCEPVNNTDLFNGKAEVYAKSRPSYPDKAVDYIASLIPPKAVLADIGAGTGKFAVLLAECGYKLYTVEPNADMRAQLVRTLSPYPSAAISNGTAEHTGLPDSSVDAVTCAQALHWFNPVSFKAECRRILKPGGLVIAVYNNMPDGGITRHASAIDTFFTDPVIREFSNPVYFTRESWISYMTSHSHDPLPSDPGYAEHIEEQNKHFDRENAGGLLRLDAVTTVYSEKI